MTATNESVLDGVLPVDKPAGPTSHDIVALARRALRTRRIGHTGTLDPFASGLMLLCVGRATRLAEYLSGLDKGYVAEVRIGVMTDTDDLTGSVTAEHDTAALTCADVERALDAQRGRIRQLPPSYSAKKVGGVRAHHAARAGRALELVPVEVTIDELRMTDCRMPRVTLEVGCSSGTYIRAIARDLGLHLGVGGHLTALRRTRVGRHHVADALTPDRLEDHEAVRAALIPPLDAIGTMPRIELPPADVTGVRQGRAVRVPDGTSLPGGDTVALAAGGELVAIARVDHGLLRPRKVFP